MLLVGMQNGVSLWNTTSYVLIKLNMHLPYGPAIVFLGTYSRIMSRILHIKVCALMF